MNREQEKRRLEKSLEREIRYREKMSQERKTRRQEKISREQKTRHLEKNLEQEPSRMEIHQISRTPKPGRPISCIRISKVQRKALFPRVGHLEIREIPRPEQA